MHLKGIVGLAAGLPALQDVVRELAAGQGEASAALPDAVKPLVLAALWRGAKRPLMVVTPRPEAARQLHEQIVAYAGEDPAILLFPEPDSLPYERLASDPSTVHQRLAALAALAGVARTEGASPPLVVASAYAVAAKVMPPQRFRSATHTIERGGRVDLMRLVRRWGALGYRMETAVVAPGLMSRRGGIVDVYAPTMDLPSRIELFGDVVDSIRRFDPATQRSAGLVQSMTVTPASEAIPPSALPPSEKAQPPELDLSRLSPEWRERFQDELDSLARGESFEEIEFYRGLLHQGSALEYLSPEGILALDEPPRIIEALEEIDEQVAELRARLIGEGRLPPDMPASHLTAKDLEAAAAAVPRRLSLASFGDVDGRFPFGGVPSYGGRTKVLMDEIKEMMGQGRRIVLVTHQAPRLAELLQDADIFATPVADLVDMPPKGAVALVHGSLSEGWSLPAEETVVLTDTEIFGIAKQRRRLRHRPVRSATRGSFLAELSVGDYLVHIDHGIGRFAESIVRRSGDREREFLVLEYAAGDRLLVPTDQIDRVGPYVGSGERTPTLTRLGTQEWNRMKARVKASTAEVARGLLALYASREVVAGHSFGPDSPWQAELEASFPYVETPDQLRAIAEVKADMEGSKPMDRIITGDVGYGKTEVALRAAFKSVMEGRQVAILVPTTVLAQQHLNTFTERLAPFPVRVEMLSRFRSHRQQAEVVAAMASGAVDICIGTHRLLQKDVSFKDLGLVIIDEEQRFGVAHKERLKQLRREVDVLSMSATPIPRTLYMSLAGVRDMSVMETPPEDRLPIKTFVSQYDETTVREAIVRELERGGQVFLVHNRVYSIGAVAQRIGQLVPEARVAVAHGQMPEDRLESVMLEFSDGQTDVLVTTTIIESGLDMPNVNTLIVTDADRMGLSQLYQLRGRVGRGATRAYAYFMYRPDKRLTDTAEKRLKMILSASELGAGFRIAMKDLEIRGAGNLLGTEQHGHIAAIGFDLYVRLLADAVAELKAGGDGVAPVPALVVKTPAPSIDLPMPAHIPEAYVADLSTRLDLYQRMGALTEPTQIDDLADELKDRFGPWPEPVEDLLFMVKVKLLAARAGVLSVSHETGEIVLAGDEKTWVRLLGVQRPYGDGIRIGHTRVRLDIKRLGNAWRGVLEKMLSAVGEG